MRKEPTETDLNSPNCLEIYLLNKTNVQYNDIRKCGNNIVDEIKFKKIKKKVSHIFSNKNDIFLLCKNGYITLKGSYIACNYQQKSRLIAVLLEILGLGFGHFYIGKHMFFFAKFLSCLLFCYMIVCIIFLVGAINGSNVSEETNKSSTKIVKLIFPLIYILYFVDIICFCSGFHLDQNDQPLY